MSRVLTLDEWNGILTDINTLAADPPTGCTAKEPLPLVEAPHIWTLADIIAARNKLIEICPDTEFNINLDYEYNQRWREILITELENAIDDGWCGCVVPCEDDVVLPFSGPTEETYTLDWMVICTEASWPCIKDIRKGSILGAYPALNGFQVFPDFYSAPYGASHPTNVRSYWAGRTRTPVPCFDAGGYYICDGDLSDIGVASGSVQPNGTILLFGDPEIGSGQLVLEVQTHDDGPLIPWPGSYEVHGYCTQVGLDNFTIPVGTPADTLVGHITCSNDLFSATLHTNSSLYQTGDEVRTSQGFYWETDVSFALDVDGPGLTYGATRYFTLKVR